jgi:hypothetical protein
MACVLVFCFAAVVGGVYMNYYRYYTYVIDQPNLDVAFSTDLANGLIDLYVSANPLNQNPTQTWNDFASPASFQSTHVMVIRYSSLPSACQTALQAGSVRVCRLLQSVFHASAAMFFFKLRRAVLHAVHWCSWS